MCKESDNSLSFFVRFFEFDSKVEEIGFFRKLSKNFFEKKQKRMKNDEFMAKNIKNLVQQKCGKT